MKLRKFRAATKNSSNGGSLLNHQRYVENNEKEAPHAPIKFQQLHKVAL